MLSHIRENWHITIVRGVPRGWTQCPNEHCHSSLWKDADGLIPLRFPPPYAHDYSAEWILHSAIKTAAIMKWVGLSEEEIKDWLAIRLNTRECNSIKYTKEYKRIEANHKSVEEDANEEVDVPLYILDTMKSHYDYKFDSVEDYISKHSAEARIARNEGSDEADEESEEERLEHGCFQCKDDGKFLSGKSKKRMLDTATGKRRYVSSFIPEYIADRRYLTELECKHTWHRYCLNEAMKLPQCCRLGRVKRVHEDERYVALMEELEKIPENERAHEFFSVLESASGMPIAAPELQDVAAPWHAVSDATRNPILHEGNV